MNPFNKRRAGVLLHPTSLPSDSYTGELNADAYRFVDFLASAGLSIWQILPINPVNLDGSPYLSPSACAGNIHLIDLQPLVDENLLTAKEAEKGKQSAEAKQQALQQAGKNFCQQASPALLDAFRAFQAKNKSWLPDYSLFTAIHVHYQGRPWYEWPKPLRRKRSQGCTEMKQRLACEVAQLEFEQFIFFRQWQSLREYAHSKGVYLFGDMPLYVHLDSCDVWAHQQLFQLNKKGQPLTVAGVPPDYFSEDGQRWGNPQYDWPAMEQDGFQWWLLRLGILNQHLDIVRIDHFRGLEAYWEIDAKEISAKSGHWVKAPGQAMLNTVKKAYPELCLVAENLGTITAEVEELREAFDLPGMTILQFAFDGSPDNPYLPHQHHSNEVVYTGTHDNDTTVGWFNSLDDHTRTLVYNYYGQPREAMPWMLIRMAFASVAKMAIIPMQDFLALPGDCRMNKPGTEEDNWQWQFQWSEVPDQLAGQIAEIVGRYHRWG